MGSAASEWVLSLANSPWVFVALALVLAFSGTLTFLPTQSLVIALATIAYARPDPALVTVLLLISTTVGMVTGDLGAFGLARWMNLGRWRWLNGGRVQRTRRWMRRRLREQPHSTMISARLVPMGRLATTLACADLRMPTALFARLSAVGSLVWAIYSTVIGAIAGIWVEKHPVLVLCVAVVVAMLIGMIASRVQTRLMSREPHEDQPEGLS
ncbi:DedA family protein [Pseudoclavibacter sp. 13-3]|uniref:DedA family protein n=1 Tax=Pseudoclavibacter sp. 13-3 TaxID=2901228 RepID=UPI001E310AFF|nr:VTT domain-containing protein [Pseudoclavibacter sp. 13-3]MCD7102092.1 VTT domain-containing protein [Pseudoclavibacter sp. 13-3]